MKIVADESVDRQVVDRLRAGGHIVLYVAEIEPGIDDQAVLLRSRQTNFAFCRMYDGTSPKKEERHATDYS